MPQPMRRTLLLPARTQLVNGLPWTTVPDGGEPDLCRTKPKEHKPQISWRRCSRGQRLKTAVVGEYPLSPDHFATYSVAPIPKCRAVFSPRPCRRFRNSRHLRSRRKTPPCPSPAMPKTWSRVVPCSLLHPLFPQPLFHSSYAARHHTDPLSAAPFSLATLNCAHSRLSATVSVAA